MYAICVGYREIRSLFAVSFLKFGANKKEMLSGETYYN